MTGKSDIWQLWKREADNYISEKDKQLEVDTSEKHVYEQKLILEREN